MFSKEKVIRFFDKFLYWMVIAIPFAGSFSSALINIFIGWSITAYFFKKVLLKKWPKENPITIPFLFLFVISVISMFNSADLVSSTQGLFKLIKYGFLFLIITESVVDVNHVIKIIISITCGLFLTSIDAIYQLVFGKDFLRNHVYDFVIGLPRLKAAFPHTNLFALYIGLMLPLCICLGFYFFRGKRKLFFTIVSILSVYCLFFTFSRGAIIGFLVAIIIIAISQKDKRLLAIITIVIVSIPFLLPSSIKDWVKGRSSVWEVLFNAERIYIYKTAVNMIKHHPFIGVGVNTFSQNYLNYKINQTYGNTGESKYYGHNNFLHMAGEIGLIGLGIFLWLLFILFRKWYIIYKLLPGGSFLKICSLGIISCIIGFLINGLTETGLYNSKVATLFWFQVGLLLAVLKVAEVY